ncbi:polysaccharide lyase family 1 protein [Melanomma pulvis-pyrius CBS 109.77]|uniref:Polysaccharide lyase family 1 protein n=1 Tax=Melanomma pulvis-pyrius CBS 109.77 TaxID=1314802 RepID=A0A6A6XB21_9PLEO|nr:polysaccharide lyase family 1 protein [Melanomma pulvis-pyrius CBS 109.77]
MKLSFLAHFASLVLIASSNPTGCDFSLVGFGKDNPFGPTIGGKGGETVIVTSNAALISAVAGSTPRIVYAQGTFILDNDGITTQNSTRVWIDHNEFESDINHGPDYYDGQCDIVRGSDWVTVSWNYFHDHWKSSLVGNSDAIRDVDTGHLHITYHHNYWRNEGTRGPAGRFGHQHIFNNLYEDFHYQAIHSRSDNQVLVEGNVFTGNTTEALSTYGLVIPADSPNTSPDGDYEIDGFANLGAKNDWGPATINITQVGNFTKAPYMYSLTPLKQVQKVVKAGAGLGKI